MGDTGEVSVDFRWLLRGAALSALMGLFLVVGCGVSDGREESRPRLFLWSGSVRLLVGDRDGAFLVFPCLRGDDFAEGCA